jgi:hypothetical protein
VHERKARDCFDEAEKEASNMSGGMEDAAAHGRQERALREAAYRLAVSLREASDGHRGWAMSSLDIAEVVNTYLQDEDAPFELRPAVRR